MGLILDSSVLIHLERRRAPADFSRWEQHGDAYLSAVTASELLVGVHRADTEARRARRSAFVEAILARIPLLPFDAAAARMHARIYATLAREGRLIGAHDLLIAATALSNGFPVLTGNVDEFERVVGLEVLRFSTD